MLKEDFLGGDHGEPSSDILMHRVAELRPRSALDGLLAKPSICELASASGGCDLNLIAIVVEIVLLISFSSGSIIWHLLLHFLGQNVIGSQENEGK